MAADGNIIANNGGAGVNVLDPDNSGLNVGNAILSNSIYGNAALGIDLGGNGVTMNHSGGLIMGPNGYQNYPVLSSAVTSASQTTIDGSLNAADSETFTIQFFSNVTADPSGYGQGQTYLGSISVMTNSSGNATFSATFNFGLTPGLAISATATDPNGNTSEFGLDVTLTDPPKGAVVRSGRGKPRDGRPGTGVAVAGGDRPGDLERAGGDLAESQAQANTLMTRFTACGLARATRSQTNGQPHRLLLPI